jgi:hypothetical protein
MCVRILDKLQSHVRCLESVFVPLYAALPSFSPPTAHAFLVFVPLYAVLPSFSSPTAQREALQLKTPPVVEDNGGSSLAVGRGH